MPDFKDLKEIKEKIDSIGDEKNILEEKGIPTEETQLPEEKAEVSPGSVDESINVEEEAVKEEAEKEEITEEEDLLGDILEDFEKGHVLQEEGGDVEEPSIEAEEEQLNTESEELKDLLADTEMKKDEDTEAIDEGIDALLSEGVDKETVTEGEIEDTGDMGLGFDEESELGDIEKMQELGEIGEEPKEDFEMPDLTDEESKEAEDLEGFIGGELEVPEEEVKEDASVVGDEELDALLKQTPEEEKAIDIEEEPKKELDEDVSEMIGEAEEPISQIEEESTSEEILDKLGEKEAESKFDDLPDLESLLGEGEGEVKADISEEGIGEEIETKEDFEMPDITAEEGKESEGLEGFIGGEGLEGQEEEFMQDFEMPDITAEEGKESEGLEGFIGEEFKESESDLSEGFDLDKISEEIGAESVGEYPSAEAKEEEISDIEGLEVKDSTYGEVPEEISKEDLKADHDVQINLTEDERKQIIISLTSLPKDAELKISKAIASNKYSNAQLKPLINALIDKESPHIIIKYYEKITGDKSLSAIEGVKYTGVKFEERKKTIGYIFEKNILPFLAKISVVVVIAVLLGLFVYYVVRPTYIASKLYKEGRVLIDNKYYEEGEDKFEKAFDKQPRFREVVKYARKYRDHKRYLATEKKYELALNMRPANDNIVLEYSDFLREKKDFERSERMYMDMIKTDRSKLQATLGLAKTYYDWSEEEIGRLEDAEETYKDALEIDRNNREAIFGNLRINIKQNNHKAIINHYNYIEKKFKRKVDPQAYSELAEYFMRMDEINEVKKVLDRASRSIKRKEFYPEIEYQYARYKKYLSIFDEEEKHLKNALAIFERMKNEQTGKFEDDKYKRLLANVYNDLGENAEVSVQANPEAEKYYIKAIEIDKNYGTPYYNLGNFALKYKPGGYDEAKNHYIDAEKNGFINDRLNYNLGWIYYKEKDYTNAYNRINRIFDVQPENSNLKFILGTIYYKLGNYELSESILLDNYLHFMDLKERYDPLDPAEKEDKIIMEMLKKTSNNLGAAYQKRYEETLNSRYLIKASKYYADSILYFDKLENIYVSEVDVYGTGEASYANNLTDKKGYANINFRMVLFPYGGVEEPILYEDFPYEFTIFM